MKKIIILLVVLACFQSVNAMEIMPDNKLYFLDRAIERMHIWVTIPSDKKVSLNLEFAEERLQEAKTMIIANKLETFKKVQQIHDMHIEGIESNMENMDPSDIRPIKDWLSEHEKDVMDLTETINREELSATENDELEGAISAMSTRVGVAGSEAQLEIDEKVSLEKGWVTDGKIIELLDNVNSWGRVQSMLISLEGETAMVRIQEAGADTQVFSFKVSEGVIIRCDCESSNVFIINSDDVKEIVEAIDAKRPTRLTSLAMEKYGVTKKEIDEIMR